jgi:hypothetical protein
MAPVLRLRFKMLPVVDFNPFKFLRHQVRGRDLPV